MSAFTPRTSNGNASSTIPVSVTATSQTITVPPDSDVVRVLNTSTTVVVFVEIGPLAVVPSAPSTPGVPIGSMPIQGGAGSIPLLLGKGRATQISLIGSAAGPTTVYLTFGSGDTVG